MKIINTIINAVIEILLTATGLGLISGFGYILYTSNAIADSSNLTTYLSTFSWNVLPVHGLAIAVVGIAIFLTLVKNTMTEGPQIA